MSPEIPKRPFSFGLFMTRPHLKFAIGAFLAVLVATGLDRFTVVILKNLTDTVAKQPIDIHSIWFWAIAYPVINFFAQCIWRISGFSGLRWFMNARSTGYISLYGYLAHHSKDYFNNRFAGSLANKISNAVEGAEDMFESFLWNYLPLVLGLGWYVIFAWSSNTILGLIIVVWSLIFVGANAYMARILLPYSYRFALSMSNLKGSIVDSLSNISLVHESAYLKKEKIYINSFIHKQRDVGIERWRVSEWVTVVNGVLIFIFMLAMLGSSVYLFQRGLVSIGVIVMVVFIISDLSGQLFRLGKEMRDTARSFGESEEGLEEILKSHEILESGRVQDLVVSKGEIVFDSISFEYENTRVFDTFSLKINPGQKVGLVGRSGAGKSTFVALLLRHFDLQQGSICIDGQDIKGVTLESLRRAISFVPQDTSLFHRSIRENIRYSRPDATDEEVIQAAKLARADDFISRLPDTYETLVGERGVKLSGGQRQRVAIARAFLKNSHILILDEATSSLDSESEQAIQQSLEKLMKDRTVIAIAHRLSTLKEMDRLLILENGKIVEDGPPSELLKKEKGVFKAMWDHQVSGFITED